MKTSKYRFYLRILPGVLFFVALFSLISYCMMGSLDAYRDLSSQGIYTWETYSHLVGIPLFTFMMAIVMYYSQWWLYDTLHRLHEKTSK